MGLRKTMRGMRKSGMSGTLYERDAMKEKVSRLSAEARKCVHVLYQMCGLSCMLHKL